MFKILAGILLISMVSHGAATNAVWDISDICTCIIVGLIGSGLDSIIYKK